MIGCGLRRLLTTTRIDTAFSNNKLICIATTTKMNVMLRSVLSITRRPLCSVVEVAGDSRKKLEILANKGNWQATYTEFKRQTPSNYGVDQLLYCCAKTGDWNRAKSTWDFFHRFKLRPTPFSFSNLFTVIANSKIEDTTQLEETLMERVKWVRKKAGKLHLKNFNALLRVFVAHRLPEHAFEVWKEMEKEQVEPDIATFTLLVRAAGATGKSSRVDEFAASVPHSHRDVRFINSLMSAYLSCNSLEKVCKLGDELLANGQLDLRGISMICRAYAELKNPQKSVEILQIISEKKVPLDTSAVNMLLALCTSSVWSCPSAPANLNSDSRIVEALDRLMKRSRIRGDGRTYALLISHHCTHQRPRLAFRYLIEAFKYHQTLSASIITRLERCVDDSRDSQLINSFDQTVQRNLCFVEH